MEKLDRLETQQWGRSEGTLAWICQARFEAPNTHFCPNLCHSLSAEVGFILFYTGQCLLFLICSAGLRCMCLGQSMLWNGGGIVLGYARVVMTNLVVSGRRETHKSQPTDQAWKMALLPGDRNGAGGLHPAHRCSCENRASRGH